jgi:D-xylose transport system substrate-binding protein
MGSGCIVCSVKLPRITAAISIIVLTAAALTACSAQAAPVKIGLLLPDTVTARYATDHSDFVAAVQKIDPNAKVIYGNAAGSAATQLAQAEDMLKGGVKVLVLDPYDPAGAESIVATAKAKHVPVIDYDTLINGTGSTYFVGSDDELAGKLQAKAMVAQLKSSGVASGSRILMVDGDAKSLSATLVAKGAHSVIDGSGFTVLDEYKTPGGVPSFAAQWVQQKLTAQDNSVAAVYAATDGLANGAISAAMAAGLDPSTLAITGRGASFTAIQNLLAGNQLMTVYSPIKPEAAQAAKLAVELAGGTVRKASSSVPTSTGSSVPAFLLPPTAVTAANARSSVVKDGFATAKQICTQAFTAKCAAAGIR